jgi:excinuclease UvrABC nuclease subunit
MTNNCGVYQIKNVITGDYYIGSSNNLRQRICHHRNELEGNKHCNRHLQYAWNKYGEQSFDIKVLLLCDNENKLYYEQVFIDGLKPAYNIAICAAAPWQGRKHTAETRAKISAANKGELGNIFGKHHADETRAKMSEAKKGNTYNLGRKLTEEHKCKISEANKGKPNSMTGKHHSEETREKMSEAHKGKHLSDERKRKLIETHTGKHLSEETRAKISEAQKISWMKRNA